MGLKIDWNQVVTKAIIGLGGLADTVLIFLGSLNVRALNSLNDKVETLNISMGVLHDQNNAQDIKISAHEIEIAFLKKDIIQLTCNKP